jgi:hypothetical protein
MKINTIDYLWDKNYRIIMHFIYLLIIIIIIIIVIMDLPIIPFIFLKIIYYT